MEIKEYLHKQFIHTNKVFPVSHNVDLNKYPEQMDIVGTEQTLQFRYKDVKYQGYLTTPTHADRPHDDTPDYHDSRESQEYEDRYYCEAPFLVMRADNEEPYKFVAINTANYGDVITCDSRHWDDLLCHIIPGQDNRFIGLSVRPYYINKFPDDISEFVEAIPEANIVVDNGYLEAYTISADVSEPGYCVVLNFIGDNKYQVLLDDECLFEILPSPDLDDVRSNTQKFKEILIKGRTPYGAQ